MRRVPIRMKLATALAVPMLGLFLVTAVEVVETTRESARVRSQTELARSSLGPSGLITTLQNERTWAVVELVGIESLIQPPVVGYQDTRRATDEAITTFREAVGGGSETVQQAFAPALASLADLTALRDSIDGSPGPRNMSNTPFSDEVYHGYAAAIRPFLEASTRVSLAVDDAELRELTWLVNLTTTQIETTSDLAREAILSIVVGGGLEAREDIAALGTIRATFDQANAELLDAGPPYDETVAARYPREMIDGLDAQLDAALAGEAVELGSLMAPLDVAPTSGYMGMRADLVEALNARADELNSAAAARERLYLVLAAGTLAATLLLTWVVSRSITRPLRSLTRQAKAMADTRLPGAVMGILDTPLGEDIAVPHTREVSVHTRDEVSDVADALNTVQDTALELAVEQAVLRRNIADSFVNLGRRNQSLLGRQLDFITSLEAKETDSNALSNLFRLDHLATRMRRNAESLLVLAGFEPPRQWAAPVRLIDVIRAALGEVENYQRVTIGGIEPVTILGSAAADLAHLLAELLENALVFSPPEHPVMVKGRAGSSGGYTLAIIDSGLGMTAADVAAANRRLAGAESFTIAPSKYLGHYVAGNLALRHGIRARLQASRGTGITAIIDLPPSLLTTADPAAAPAPLPAPRPAAAAATPPPSVGPGPIPPAPSAPPLRVPPSVRPAATPAPPPAPAPARAPRPRPMPPGAPIPARPASRTTSDLTAPLPPAPIPASGREQLTRRVQGAQPPRTTVVPLHGDRSPSSSTFDAPRRATALYELLTSFSAGVQRGLDEVREPRVPAAGR